MRYRGPEQIVQFQIRFHFSSLSRTWAKQEKKSVEMICEGYFCSYTNTTVRQPTFSSIYRRGFLFSLEHFLGMSQLNTITSRLPPQKKKKERKRSNSSRNDFINTFLHLCTLQTYVFFLYISQSQYQLPTLIS